MKALTDLIEKYNTYRKMESIGQDYDDSIDNLISTYNVLEGKSLTEDSLNELIDNPDEYLEEYMERLEAGLVEAVLPPYPNLFHVEDRLYLLDIPYGLKVTALAGKLLGGEGHEAVSHLRKFKVYGFKDIQDGTPAHVGHFDTIWADESPRV